ncbi:restriction endonuclease subunit S [Mycoplasmopsis cynos]|uniref:restriction endonuclease subunit S n=1 Tax=Mycoplasmopsis cynos TaxID=171284 RepID=UPI00220FF051|nr:restriction endonuclease subunit S [Mycoplasmopsis cynos]UWV93856.1 restriction endonuclease subunit S [Mycoplasmopsis cynos]WAM03855.1 restriction endonuclease subunit S [Mycoplasmopsis cynos]WAM10108.1 restriction endonuclease subunit S [Mycoplasmopsis cynos]
MNKNDLVMILNDKTQACNILGRVLKIDKDDEYIHNQRTQRITLDNKLFLSGYFYFYINSNKFRNKIKQISQGNTQVYINWSIANKCVLKYPSLLDEQNKIAVIFNNINSLITLHQRELKILKIFKKSLFVKMIVGKNLTILSATLTKITNVWEQERLGEIVDYFNGSSNEKEQTNEGKFEIVNLNSISISGELKPSGKFLHNAFETLKKGDIVMILSDIALGNLLGKSAVIIDMF